MELWHAAAGNALACSLQSAVPDVIRGNMWWQFPCTQPEIMHCPCDAQQGLNRLKTCVPCPEDFSGSVLSEGEMLSSITSGEELSSMHSAGLVFATPAAISDSMCTLGCRHGRTPSTETQP